MLVGGTQAYTQVHITFFSQRFFPVIWGCSHHTDLYSSVNFSGKLGFNYSFDDIKARWNLIDSWDWLRSWLVECICDDLKCPRWQHIQYIQDILDQILYLFIECTSQQ